MKQITSPTSIFLVLLAIAALFIIPVSGVIAPNSIPTVTTQVKPTITTLSNAPNSSGVDNTQTKTQITISPSNVTANTTIMPGSDRDSHGCIPSAGYTWCEAKQKCIRTWEEACTAASVTQSTTSAQTTSAQTTTKSPLQLITVLTGIALALCALVLSKKR
jgi:hypothetical protein